MNRSLRFTEVLSLLVYFAALCGVHYFFPRSASGPVITIYLLAFVPYWYWYKREKWSVTAILSIGIFARLLLMASIPSLSDDFYRFYWDGALLVDGINPFDFTPHDYLEQYPEATVDRSAYELMNSPNYYSVYPPFLQAVFFVSKWLGGTIWGFVLVSRMFIILAELVTAWLLIALLKHFNKPVHLVALYFLNPLIVLELTGNLHNEVFMVMFVLLTFWLFIKHSYVLAAIALSLAVGAKLYPVLLVPLFLLRLTKTKAIMFALAFSATSAILFLPFGGWEELNKVLTSLRLYYQSFEFNGSIYAIGRFVGYQLTGYNLIGPWGKALAVLSISGFVWVYFRKRTQRTEERLFMDTLLIIFCMYALSTSVMPWYLSLMIVVSPFTQWRFPLVWSALIPLSYSAFSDSTYQENYGLIAVEYLLLLCYLLYEYRKIKRQPEKNLEA